jgi:hypothetical protein
VIVNFYKFVVCVIVADANKNSAYSPTNLLKVLSSENYGRAKVVLINGQCFDVVVLDIIF